MVKIFGNQLKMLLTGSFSVPILLTGIQKQCKCKIWLRNTLYSYFCKAFTHPESDQARRCDREHDRERDRVVSSAYDRARGGKSIETRRERKDFSL